MYVCHCKVVTDGTIRRAIACGARDLRAVAEVCGGAGDDCGGCVPAIQELLDEADRRELVGAGPAPRLALTG